MITGKLHQHSPIRILSLANSSSFMETMSFPSTAAFRAAWLTRFSRSAPEKPTVPRAITLASIAAEKRQNSSPQVMMSCCPQCQAATRFLVKHTWIHFNLL